MSFRRLPSYLPNIYLRLLPLSEAEQKVFEKTGFLRKLTFRTTPSTNKVRLAVAGWRRRSAAAAAQSCGLACMGEAGGSWYCILGCQLGTFHQQCTVAQVQLAVAPLLSSSQKVMQANRAPAAGLTGPLPPCPPSA